MKNAYYIFTFILIGCSSNVKYKSEATNLPEQHAKAMKSFQQYTIRDTIAADLNGDSMQDLAYFKTNINRKSIVVRDGKTKKEITIGLDKSFKDIGSNFNWVDNWGTTNDSEVYENVISNGEIIGGKKVKLTNKSLFVGKDDAGGGIITFKAGRFLWIHQAD